MIHIYTQALLQINQKTQKWQVCFVNVKHSHIINIHKLSNKRNVPHQKCTEQYFQHVLYINNKCVTLDVKLFYTQRTQKPNYNSSIINHH